MALGMTYEDYWYGDVFKARAFLKADAIRQERYNELAWLFGLYNAKALEATVGNIFRDENSPAISYPQEPYRRGTSEEKAKKLEAESEQERLRLVAHLNRVMVAMQQK